MQELRGLNFPKFGKHLFCCPHFPQSVSGPTHAKRKNTRPDPHIPEKKRIAAVYLFGSTATGRDRRGSDLDLAIITKRTISRRETIMVDKELLSRKLSQRREYLVALRNADDITWKKNDA